MGATNLIVIIITSLIVILFPIKVVTIFTNYYCDKKKIYSMSSSKSINHPWIFIFPDLSLDSNNLLTQ